MIISVPYGEQQIVINFWTYQTKYNYQKPQQLQAYAGKTELDVTVFAYYPTQYT